MFCRGTAAIVQPTFKNGKQPSTITTVSSAHCLQAPVLRRPNLSASITPTMAMQTDISDVLAEQREQTPEELQHLFLQLEDYWERKLWHELTEALLQFFKHPASRPQRRPLYDTFIKSFASKINQLKLVTLGMQASMQYKGSSSTERYSMRLKQRR